MKHRALLLISIFVFHCAAQAQTPRQLADDWQRQHITRIEPSRVRHADLQRYLEGLRVAGVRVREVGRSFENREIYQIEFGTGPLKILMWSQMHGDEPTATSTLIDMFDYLQRNRSLPWIAEIERRISLRAVPMLNPDGAEIFQRRNLQFIDINRDARALVTPEGRLLKRLRDEWSPHIGFNLHNQNPLTAVGDTGRQAAISLLAVASDAQGSVTPGRLRSKRICAVMIESLAPFISGHIGRYDDTFNPRAFGDMISQWGTPVILVETGALHGRSEMDLVQLNFVALMSALRALANGEAERADPALYDRLPYNSTGTIFSLVIRGANIVNRSQAGTSAPAFIADIAINENSSFIGGQRQRRAAIQEVGDMSFVRGLSEVDARNYFVITASGTTRPGAEAALLFYRRERANQINWLAIDLETRFPPDAVYRNGEWTRRGNLTIR
jgi:hypothetical protein